MQHGNDLYAARVGWTVGDEQSALSRRTTSADVAACSERCWDEFTGWWHGWGDSDSSGRVGGAVGGFFGWAAASLCRSAMARSTTAACGQLSRRFGTSGECSWSDGSGAGVYAG